MSKANDRAAAELCVCNAACLAMECYTADHIDAVYNEETGMIDIMYHSRNNSFAIETGVVEMDHIDKHRLAQQLDDLGIGHCL